MGVTGVGITSGMPHVTVPGWTIRCVNGLTSDIRKKGRRQALDHLDWSGRTNAAIIDLADDTEHATVVMSLNTYIRLIGT